MQSRFSSPLRYPGGKQQLSGYIKKLISVNNLYDGIYVEPYAGGAGVALELLFSEHVREIHLNDLDKNLYAFWFCVLNDTENLLTRLESIKATLENWYLQHEVLMNANDNTPLLDRAFATLFLNRCNRSGILKAGPIGGKAQTGKWKIDARYNVADISERINRIARYKSSITISNKDCIDFLIDEKPCLLERKSLVYLDPPYYQKGQELYMNAYEAKDHTIIADFLRTIYTDIHWIVSYDACLPIANLYQSFRSTEQILNYSVSSKHSRGNEFVFYSPNMVIPTDTKIINPYNYLENVAL